MENVTFHDHKPAALSLYDAVVNGLSQKEKTILSKFFYDERGSALFDRICEQPAYYPPTVEFRMLAGLGVSAPLSLPGPNRCCESRRAL